MKKRVVCPLELRWVYSTVCRDGTAGAVPERGVLRANLFSTRTTGDLSSCGVDGDFGVDIRLLHSKC